MEHRENPTDVIKLSNAARSRIDWRRINDSMIGARSRSGDEEASRRVSPEKVREIFVVAKREFRLALSSLRKLMMVCSWLVVVSIAIAIAGFILILVLNEKLLGSVASGLSLSSLTAIIFKMWQLGRDQAMLELIPTRYEIALGLAVTDEQFSQILDRFLAETESIRTPPAG